MSESPDVPVNPEEPGQSGLPDPQPDKRTEGGEGGTDRPASPGQEDVTGAASAAPAGTPDQATDEAALEEAARAVVEDVSDLAQVAAQRDEYLDALRHLQADFENYRKRVQKQQADAGDRAVEALVNALLPVLDTADLAVSHDESEALLQLASSLYDVLGKQGLERLDPAGQPFDPNEHEAVLHEPGDGDPEVIEVLRAGFRWKGRVIRPAMVKVKGS